LVLIFAVTTAGTTIKSLTIFDEGSRCCIDIVAGRTGAAEMIRVLQEWLGQAGIRIRFIELCTPWPNGVNESFHGRFRDECLNRELLGSVLEAQVIARAFQEEYNTERPHTSIGYQVPAEYRALLLGQAPGSGQAREAGPSLRPELACTSQSANNPEPKPEPAQTLT
jgi:transposase InsO family protein